MPRFRPSRAIRCPFCGSAIFKRAFAEHLETVHGLSTRDAKSLTDSAKWPDFEMGKPHGKGQVSTAMFNRIKGKLEDVE